MASKASSEYINYHEIEKYFTEDEFQQLNEYDKKRMAEDKKNFEMMTEAGIDVKMPMFMRQPEDDIHPEDSVSSVSNARKSYVTHISSSSSKSSRMRQSAQARAIKLSTQLAVLQEQQELEERKRQLERIMCEDDASEEKKMSQRKAQEIITLAEENTIRRRRQQEIMNEQTKIQQKQEELKLKAEYEAAISISQLYREGSSVNLQSQRYQSTRTAVSSNITVNKTDMQTTALDLSVTSSNTKCAVDKGVKKSNAASNPQENGTFAESQYQRPCDSAITEQQSQFHRGINPYFEPTGESVKYQPVSAP